jgi:hypothetical protein
VEAVKEHDEKVKHDVVICKIYGYVPRLIRVRRGVFDGADRVEVPLLSFIVKNFGQVSIRVVLFLIRNHLGQKGPCDFIAVV